MTSDDPPSDPAEYGNLQTGAAHELIVDLEPVRIRVLDRFGAPCKDMDCDVDTPLLGTRRVTIDGQGWLEIQCPKGTDHVDLTLVDATEDAERCVLLEPPDDDDDKETKRRLLNLGYDGSAPEGGGDDEDDDDDASSDEPSNESASDGDSSASDDDSDGSASDDDSDGSASDASDDDARAQQAFLGEHGLDTAQDDIDSELDRVENDYKTLDDPSQRDKSMLDDQVGDADDPGERT